MRSCVPAFAALLCVSLLAGCGYSPGEMPRASARGEAKRLGDVKPHLGVAAAHKMPIHGIDVSWHDGSINWAAVKNAGITFAYIKATEGGDRTDPKFTQNWEAAKEAGVRRGAYHFVFWCRPAKEQALFFLLNVPPDPNALPPALDVEWNDSSPSCHKGVKPAEARAMMKVMLTAMEAQSGKRPIIYTDINFYRDVLASEGVGDYQLWLRSVAAEPQRVYPGQSYAMWQFTSTAKIPGIQGLVDRNAFNGTPAEWAHWIGEDRVKVASVGTAAK